MKPKATILIADDENDLRELLVQRLNRKGYQATGVPGGQEALGAISRGCFDLGVFDIRMPEIDGIELLRRAREAQPDMQVLMLTGHGTIETAIEAMRAGAYDYLTKPCNLSELEVVLEKALEQKRLLEQNDGLKEMVRRHNGTIVGQSAAIRRVIEITSKVADSDSPVLIEGKSGTGKELIAQALHSWSSRANQPLQVVNAGALPANLLESELFGHEKGAFTGAIARRKGLVEMADRGTLFLDEIGEMDQTLQVKLLRFLETGEFRRIGDNRLRRVDVRVVAATNRRLEDEIRQGRFREDLFYRLNVVRILLPTLRERKEDIPLLAEHFLRVRYGSRERKKLASDALRALLAYDFPGNVRELANMLERAAILSSEPEIRVEDLFGSWGPPLVQNEGGTAPPGPVNGQAVAMTLEEVEKSHMLTVLRSTGWNKSRAAQILGISLRNLYRKIETYGLKEA